MRRGLLAVAAFALFLGACGSPTDRGPGASGSPGATSGPGGGPVPATGSADLVLRLRETPGLLPPGGLAAVVATFSLYGDGRLITGSPGQDSLWPALVVYRISPAEIQGLLRQAAEAGLLDAARPSQPAVGPDAPVRIVTVVTTTARRTTTVPRSDPAVQRLSEDLTRYATGPSSAYQPSAVAVVATVSDDPAAPTRTWPLTSLDGQPMTGTAAGSRCTLLRAADIDTVRQASGGATAATRWTSGGHSWMVALHPLLPDEPDCSVL